MMWQSWAVPFPTAQLSKASALGLRNEINARQGETLTLEQGTMLFYTPSPL